MTTTNKLNIADNIIETIGRTPLVRLNQGKMLDLASCGCSFKVRVF